MSQRRRTPNYPTYQGKLTKLAQLLRDLNGSKPLFNSLMDFRTDDRSVKHIYTHEWYTLSQRGSLHGFGRICDNGGQSESFVRVQFIVGYFVIDLSFGNDIGGPSTFLLSKTKLKGLSRQLCLSLRICPFF